MLLSVIIVFYMVFHNEIQLGKGLYGVFQVKVQESRKALNGQLKSVLSFKVHISSCIRSGHLWKSKAKMSKIDGFREMICFSHQYLANPNLQLYWIELYILKRKMSYLWNHLTCRDLPYIFIDIQMQFLNNLNWCYRALVSRTLT